MKIVNLRAANLTNIPAMLREVADSIEKGRHGEVRAMSDVMLADGRDPVIFGWGLTDSIHSLGVLQIGLTWLAQSHRAPGEKK